MGKGCGAALGKGKKKVRRLVCSINALRRRLGQKPSPCFLATFVSNNAAAYVQAIKWQRDCQPRVLRFLGRRVDTKRCAWGVIGARQGMLRDRLTGCRRRPLPRLPPQLLLLLSPLRSPLRPPRRPPRRPLRLPPQLPLLRRPRPLPPSLR